MVSVKEESKESKPPGYNIISKALPIVALAMVIYQLVFTQVLLQSPTGHRITHLGFAFAIVFMSLLLKNRRHWLSKWSLLLASLAVSGYFMYNLHDILVMRSYNPNLGDSIMGPAAVLLTFIASYLIFGKTFPVIAAIAVTYLILGRNLPFPFTVAAVPVEQLIVWLTVPGIEEGLFGHILAISSNYLFLFVLFGALLQGFGGTRFIMGLGQLVGSKLKSGPAATAVLGSSLVGTVTGSTVANITITGAFTIPLMKKAGYTPEQAGAIEAVSSNGGQIMPPIMGATAFIMSGFTGIPYIQIVVASILPAVLYFFSIFIYVQLTAHKGNIEAPKMAISRRRLLYDAPLFFIPLGVLVYLLAEGYTLPFVAFWSMMSLIALGLIYNVRKEDRLNFRELKETITNGVVTASEIAVVCALIGIVATSIAVSGLGMKLPMLIEDISRGYLIIALLIAMVSSLILGMGVPTAVAYIMVAVGAAPALIRMGVPLLQAHLFPFIFAVFSHITPPIAIGALVASRLAIADYWGTTRESIKAAFTAFLLPFFIIYAPVLILRPEGSLTQSITTIIAILLAVVALQISVSNYGFTLLRPTERINFLLTGLLFLAFVFTKGYPWLLAGTTLFIVGTVWQINRRRLKMAGQI